MPTDTGAGDPRPAARSWLRIALVVSLALNFLAIGIAAGSVMGGWRHGKHGPHGKGGSIAKFVDRLPQDRRAVLEPILAKGRVAIEASRRASRDEELQLVAAIRARPYVPARFEEALDKLVAADTAARRQAGRGLGDIIAAMTDDERLAYAERRQARLEHKRHRDKHKDD
ncbi:MAG: periplasmic heavy metal sensor [Hyphomicrobiaceae bacterium]|nr:periplasmic heavy metal sensor [Hyphomicrobiaceae bacterium]